MHSCKCTCCNQCCADLSLTECCQPPRCLISIPATGRDLPTCCPSFKSSCKPLAGRPSRPVHRRTPGLMPAASPLHPAAALQWTLKPRQTPKAALRRCCAPAACHPWFARAACRSQRGQAARLCDSRSSCRLNCRTSPMRAHTFSRINCMIQAPLVGPAAGTHGFSWEMYSSTFSSLPAGHRISVSLLHLLQHACFQPVPHCASLYACATKLCRQPPVCMIIKWPAVDPVCISSNSALCACQPADHLEGYLLKAL